jgi:hypothetical protein
VGEQDHKFVGVERGRLGAVGENQGVGESYSGCV